MPYSSAVYERHFAAAVESKREGRWEGMGREAATGPADRRGKLGRARREETARQLARQAGGTKTTNPERSERFRFLLGQV